MKSVVFKILIVSLLASGSFHSLFAQDKYKSKVGIEFFKDAQNEEYLEVSVIVRIDRFQPFGGAVVKIYNSIDTSKVFLGEFTGNEEGIVKFPLDASSGVVKDSAGFFNFYAEFDGNDTIKSSDKEASFKQGNLDMSFYQKDSVKSIKVIATEINSDGDALPLEGMDIDFFVKGTFSLYKFNEAETDENGMVSVDFPLDMPGDTAGVLTVVSKIDDDKKFGTIESIGKMNWGTPIQPVVEKRRGLGDTDAPLWMVYTLIILLSAVWLHYMYVIYLIFRIKSTQ